MQVETADLDVAEEGVPYPPFLGVCCSDDDVCGTAGLTGKERVSNHRQRWHTIAIYIC